MSGSSSDQVTSANVRRETFPTYEGGLHYIQGYDPVSYSAPHSSLLKYSSWLGAGFVLAALLPLGMIVWGAAMGVFETGSAADHWELYLIIGVVATVVFFVAGFSLIWFARRHYRQYRAETGRRN